MTSRFSGKPFEWKRGMRLEDVEAQMCSDLIVEIEAYLTLYAEYVKWCRENGREP